MTQRRVNLDGQYYDYSYGTKTIEVPRELVHIAKAKRGKIDDCMNSLACLDSRDLFPHPVIAVATWGTRIFVIDQLYKSSKNGTAGHAVKYELSARDGEEISQHDLLGIGRPATLILRRPTGQPGKGHSRGTGAPHTGRGKDASRKGKMHRGEMKRLLAAVGSIR